VTGLATFLALLCGPGTVGQYATSKFVFTGFNNGVGWNSQAMVVLTGMLNCNFGFAGIDGAVSSPEPSGLHCNERISLTRPFHYTTDSPRRGLTEPPD
jgi:hypothetical protein